MIDMNDWLKSWDAYHTPAQTLSDGDVAWACLVGGGIMALVFAVLAVVSFLRHGARGIPLVVPFAIGASTALFLCISDGLCQLPKVGADDTKVATATVSAARRPPDGFGEQLERVTGVEYLSCSTRSLGIDSSVDLDVGRLPSKDRYTCRFVTRDGRLVENGRLVVDHDHGRVGLFDGDGKAVVKGKESK